MTVGPSEITWEHHGRTSLLRAFQAPWLFRGTAGAALAMAGFAGLGIGSLAYELSGFRAGLVAAVAGAVLLPTGLQLILWARLRRALRGRPLDITFVVREAGLDISGPGGGTTFGWERVAGIRHLEGSTAVLLRDPRGVLSLPDALAGGERAAVAGWMATAVAARHLPGPASTPAPHQPAPGAGLQFTGTLTRRDTAAVLGLGELNRWFLRQAAILSVMVAAFFVAAILTTSHGGTPPPPGCTPRSLHGTLGRSLGYLALLEAGFWAFLVVLRLSMRLTGPSWVRQYHHAFHDAPVTLTVTPEGITPSVRSLDNRIPWGRLRQVEATRGVLRLTVRGSRFRLGLPLHALPPEALTELGALVVRSAPAATVRLS